MKKQGKSGLRFKHWHKIAGLLMLYDVVAVNVAYFLTLWFLYDCHYSEIPSLYLMRMVKFAPVYSVACIFIFWWLRLYNSIWRFASFNELLRVLSATFLSGSTYIIGINLLFGPMRMAYYIIGTGIQFLFLLGVRFSYRFILLERSRNRKTPGTTAKRVMLIGAGNAGQLILRDAGHSAGGNLQICCIIDDNPNKWGRDIEGIPVVGGRDDILYNVEKYKIDKIFVAIPSASDESIRDILNICKETGCELKNLPSVHQLVSGDVKIGHMKDVAVEDLLGRKPIQVNMDEICRYISGKTILVTGGGGSIGSELCRQIASHYPKQLIIFDVYENNAYEIEQELKERHPELDLKVLIGSVRDSRCLDRLFTTYKPDIVYHAAAHKHVPLMETSPCEAIKNNVLGTYKTAYAAMMNGCKRFVLISTDKAVNPTNIMGASKRLCEMVVQAFDQTIKAGKAHELPKLFTHNSENTEEPPLLQDVHTEFVAVRFGNVLGSNGSVIPLFKKQILKGGPVTVTHPDIIRYFMTIPEAVGLVMQAGTYANGGEIFVLDMGAPVKIDELARNLIKLSGHKPDIDIPIVYTGLRPGEKLYEEKLMAEEGLQKTPNDLIHVGRPIPIDMEKFVIQLRQLMDAAYDNDDAIRTIVAQIVTTYCPAQGGTGEKTEAYDRLCKETVTAGH